MDRWEFSGRLSEKKRFPNWEWRPRILENGIGSHLSGSINKACQTTQHYSEPSLIVALSHHLTSEILVIADSGFLHEGPKPLPEKCGLIIKLTNKVPWHLSQWIIIKDLKISISKTRLKIVCWDNLPPSPEIDHSVFSNNKNFACVMVVHWYSLSPHLISLSTRGKGTLPMCLLGHTTRGAMSQAPELSTNLLHKESYHMKYNDCLC